MEPNKANDKKKAMAKKMNTGYDYKAHLKEMQKKHGYSKEGTERVEKWHRGGIK